MITNGKSDDESKDLQKPAQKGDSGVVAGEKTRELLEAEMIRGIQKVTGTRSQTAADRLFAEAASVLGLTLEKGSNCITMMAMLVELAPQNGIEAMLSVQMLATHEAALIFLRRAIIDGQTFEGSDANETRSLAAGYR